MEKSKDMPMMHKQPPAQDMTKMMRDMASKDMTPKDAPKPKK